MKRFVPALAVMIFCFAVQSVLAAPYAYVTQVLTGQVTVIDTEKNKKVTTINIGGAPFSIAFSPDGTKAYVASQQYPLLDHVSVIDTLTHAVSATVPVGSYPIGIAALPDGSKVYVAGNNNLSPGLTVIDTAALTVTATIPLGTTPFAVAALPDSSKVYVTDLDDHTVTAVDTSSNVAETIVTGVTNANGIAVHPDGTRVYVTSYLATDPLPTTGSIFVIDTSTNTITGTITLPGLPGAVAFNPSGTRAYVSGDFEQASLWVIDTATEAVIGTVNVGKSPVSVDVTPDGKRVYVTTAYWDERTDKEANHAIKAIDASTNRVISTIKVGGQPSSMGKFIGSVRYGLSILKDGSGTGTVASTNNTGAISCGASCEESYAIGRTVKLKVTADANSVFKGWTGGCAGTKNTCTLVMTQDYSTTATFRSDPTITVTPSKKDFNKVKLTKTSNAKFVVKNSIVNGKKDLAITNIGSSNPVFTVSVDGCTGIPVSQNKTCSFTVTFTPGSTGLQSGTITISSNDPDTPSKEIAITGEGAN